MAAPQFIGPSSAEISASSLQTFLEGMNLMRDMAQFQRTQKLVEVQESRKQADDMLERTMKDMGLGTLVDVAEYAEDAFKGWAKTKFNLSDEAAEKYRQYVLKAPASLNMYRTMKEIARETQAGTEEEEAPVGGGKQPEAEVPAKNVSFKQEGGGQQQQPAADTSPARDARRHGVVTTPVGQPVNLMLFDNGRTVQQLAPNYATYDELQQKYAQSPYSENEGTESHPRPAKFTAGIGARLVQDLNEQAGQVDATMEILKKKLQAATPFTPPAELQALQGQLQALAGQKMAIRNKQIEINADIRKYNESMKGIDAWRVNEMESLASRGFSGAQGEDYAAMQSLERQVAATNPNMAKSTPTTAPLSMQTEDYGTRFAGSYSGRIPEFAGPFDTRNIEPAVAAPAAAPAAPPVKTVSAPAGEQGIAAPTTTPSLAGQTVAAAAGAPVSAAVAAAAARTALPDNPTPRDVAVQKRNFIDVYEKTGQDLVRAQTDPQKRRKMVALLHAQVKESDYWGTVVAASGSPELAAQMASLGPLEKMYEAQSKQADAQMKAAEASIKSADVALRSAESEERRSLIAERIAQIQERSAEQDRILQEKIAKTTEATELAQLEQMRVSLAMAKAQLAAQEAAAKSAKTEEAYQMGEKLYQNSMNAMMREMDRWTSTNKVSGEKELNWDAISKSEEAVRTYNTYASQVNGALTIMEGAAGPDFKFPDAMFMPTYTREEVLYSKARNWWRDLRNVHDFILILQKPNTGAGGAQQPAAPTPGTGGASAAEQELIDEALLKK